MDHRRAATARGVQEARPEPTEADEAPFEAEFVASTIFQGVPSRRISARP
jgi:hypothetical protein